MAVQPDVHLEEVSKLVLYMRGLGAYISVSAEFGAVAAGTFFTAAAGSREVLSDMVSMAIGDLHT